MRARWKLVLIVVSLGLDVGVVGAMGSVMDYGIVIAAGSTGSRLHVYRWPSRAVAVLPPPLALPVALDGATATTEVPLTNVTHGVAALRALVTDAQKSLVGQETRFSRFPILLRATAAMRALPAEGREAILAAARAYLHSTPFMFEDSFASAMSAELEGVFWWLSVNMRKDTLSTGAATWGALDMGARATQITFQPATDILAGHFNLQLGGAYVQDLYTRSFMNFGLDEARRRVHQACVDAAVLINATGADAGVPAPCDAVGYTRSFKALDDRTYTLRGTSDYVGCMSKVLRLLDTTAGCWANGEEGPLLNRSARACSLGGTYQPPVVEAAGTSTSRFMAFGGYSRTWEFHGLPVTGGSLRDLQGKARSWCALSWPAQQAARPSASRRHLDQYCFASTYIEALLGEGYGFPYDDRTWLEVAPSSGSEVDWSVGAMAYHANQMPWRFESEDARQPWLTLFIVSTMGMTAACGIVAFMRTNSSALVRPNTLMSPRVSAH